MFKKAVFIIIGIISFAKINAQELKCNVQIISNKIQGTNRQVFQTLQSAIYEFMNSRAWTNHIFLEEEKIECNIMLQLDEQISDRFKGTIQIQSRRPVYNSSYYTTVFNFIDKDLDFRYVEYQKLEFSETEHLSNLTSILAYYAYIIIGLDYDTFSLFGGTEFFNKAQNIVSYAQNATELGWKMTETNKKNRYWLIENILSPKYKNVRQFLYEYHRLGLDIMNAKVNEGRSQIAESLMLLRSVYREKPDLYLTFYKMIFDAKSDEFVNIFSESFTDEKTRVLNILNEIDPSNQSKYNSMVNKK